MEKSKIVTFIRRHIFFFSLLLFIHYQLSIINCSYAQCGEERWDVKTLSDKDTTLINFNKIVETSVADQTALERPDKITKKSPRLPLETSVYKLNCYVIGIRRDKDMDIYMEIKDMDSPGTMIAEFPSPSCPEVHATGHYQELVDLNEWFLKNIGKPTDKFHNLKKPVPVTITGIGFFDIIHPAIGMSKNGREIHPVLKMKLLPK